MFSAEDSLVLLVLVASATALIVVAQRVRIPYPILLVFGGLALGLIPGMPEIELPPDLVLVAVLPPLLLAEALRSGHDQRTAVVFYGIAFDVTALTFNAVWQYARRHRLLSEALDSAGATAISRRFQLALAWLTTGALLGAVLPVLGAAMIAAFNAFYWLPIRGESPRPRPS